MGTGGVRAHLAGEPAGCCGESVVGTGRCPARGGKQGGAHCVCDVQGRESAAELSGGCSKESSVCQDGRAVEGRQTLDMRTLL